MSDDIERSILAVFDSIALINDVISNANRSYESSGSKFEDVTRNVGHLHWAIGTTKIYDAMTQTQQSQVSASIAAGETYLLENSQL